MVQLSTVCSFEAVCTACSFDQKQRVGITTSKNLKRSTATTFDGRPQPKECVCQQPCTSRPLIHLNEHESIHFFRVPLGPARSAEDVFSERVSHFAHCTEPSGPDTHFVPRIALTAFPSPSRTPPSPCPRSEIVCTAALRCSSSSCPSSFLPLHRVFHFGPTQNRSIALRTGSDHIPKTAPFSGDAHAPTMATPRSPSAVANELSLTSSVQTSSPIYIKTSRINIVSLVADAAAWYSASPLAFCLRDAGQSGHPSTSIFKLDFLHSTSWIDWLYLSLTFPAQSLSDGTRKNASCGSWSVS